MTWSFAATRRGHSVLDAKDTHGGLARLAVIKVSNDEASRYAEFLSVNCRFSIDEFESVTGASDLLAHHLVSQRRSLGYQMYRIAGQITNPQEQSDNDDSDENPANAEQNHF